jgi:hypothetical protein
MEQHPYSPTPSLREDLAWIDTWIAPPHGEGMRKLMDVLTSVRDASPYLTRVKHHLVDGPLRDELGITIYDETVWGVIRWNRAVGRPATPTLAAGFGIVHQYSLTFEVPPGSGHVIGDWVSAGKPQVWDGPDDEESHAVSFLLHGVAQWKNRVIVGLAQGVDWAPAEKPWMTQRQRVVAYPASLPKGEFNVIGGGAPVDLGVFEVIRTW